MVQGKYKSGRFRRVKVKTPGGKTVMHYREAKPNRAKCAVTGKQLAGVPRERPAVLGKLPKTARRPERPYGGVLSSEAMRSVLREKARDTTQENIVQGDAFAVGRLCVKIAGRDAGRTCVIVESAENGFVVVDGDVRRKKVNTKHLEPLSQTVDISNGASHDVVKKEFEKLGLSTWETKPKSAGERPRKQKKKHEAVAKPAPKVAKKPAKETKAEVKEVPKAAPVEEVPSKSPAPKAEEKKDEPKQEDNAAKLAEEMKKNFEAQEKKAAPKKTVSAQDIVDDKVPEKKPVKNTAKDTPLKE